MDRYVKTMLTLIAVSTLALALKSFTSPLPVAYAQSPDSQGRKCTWTFLYDNGAPSIGMDGKGELKGKNWKRLSAEGWRLKTTTNTGGPFLYMFERCE